ncbi:MAG: pectate lyase [Planctomycetales bacterium]|nr:pectate lyase [Planctomycetales bacterium]
MVLPTESPTGFRLATNCGRRVAWIVLAAAIAFAIDGPAPAQAISWRQAQRQPAPWFATDESRGVVASVIAYQLPCGGWDKNLDLAAPLAGAARAALADRVDEGTIDNGATVTPLRFLARAVKATGNQDAKQAFLRGLDYLLEAQYDNGGWPMYYPLRPRGYYSHIHFNDNSITNVLRLLDDVAQGRGDFDFVDERRRALATAAIERGVDCILRCQVIVDGKPTVWCAQHDEHTLAPAKARSYELPSLSGQESVGIVQFLMRTDPPTPPIAAAVEGAVDWFERVKIPGQRVEWTRDEEGVDRIVVDDPAAGPLWARFYEIGTNRPMFVGRDGVVHRRLAEIERERRVNYAYIGSWPRELVERDYPAWVARRGKAGGDDSRR